MARTKITARKITSVHRSPAQEPVAVVAASPSPVTSESASSLPLKNYSSYPAERLHNFAACHPAASAFQPKRPRDSTAQELVNQKNLLPHDEYLRAKSFLLFGKATDQSSFAHHQPFLLEAQRASEQWDALCQTIPAQGTLPSALTSLFAPAAPKILSEKAQLLSRLGQLRRSLTSEDAKSQLWSLKNRLLLSNNDPAALAAIKAEIDSLGGPFSSSSSSSSSSMTNPKTRRLVFIAALRSSVTPAEHARLKDIVLRDAVDHPDFAQLEEYSRHYFDHRSPDVIRRFLRDIAQVAPSSPIVLVPPPPSSSALFSFATPAAPAPAFKVPLVSPFPANKNIHQLSTHAKILFALTKIGKEIPSTRTMKDAFFSKSNDGILDRLVAIADTYLSMRISTEEANAEFHDILFPNSMTQASAARAASQKQTSYSKKKTTNLFSQLLTSSSSSSSSSASAGSGPDLLNGKFAGLTFTSQSWFAALKAEFSKPYFATLHANVTKAQRAGQVFPPGPLIFKALELCPLDQVKVVILGQDPYFQPGQAMGLSFSVAQGVPVPPSLVNIIKEIEKDLGCTGLSRASGDLTSWAEQGVLLLNATLTVTQGRPNSHATFGWQIFTDAVLQAVAARRQPVVFILWGAYAQKKGVLASDTVKLVLGAHPSPMTGTKFFGGRYFSKTNALLRQAGGSPIDWAAPFRSAAGASSLKAAVFKAPSASKPLALAPPRVLETLPAAVLAWGREMLQQPPLAFVPQPPEMLVFVGMPGAGKSNFTRYVQQRDQTYVIVNRDTLKTIPACLKLATSVLMTGGSVIIDNTNPSRENRKAFVDVAKRFGVKVRAIHFVVPQHVCMFLNTQRQAQVPGIVYKMWNKTFVPPSTHEGFSEVIQVSSHLADYFRDRV